MHAAVGFACMLLLLGFALRANLRVLRMMYIPASVAGGFVGLAVLQATRGGAPPGQSADPAWLAQWSSSTGQMLSGWPGPLLAIVFAGLLLPPRKRRVGEATTAAAQAGLYAWFIILGEIALGLLATWAVIRHAFDVPASFGQLVEAGFAGGHGTAAALGTVFEESLDFPEGRDLGLFAATVGLVYSVLSGLVLVNIGVRRGWTRAAPAAPLRADDATSPAHDEGQGPAPRPIGLARVSGDVLDPLALQIVFLAAAFLVGVGLQWGFMSLADTVASDEAMEYVGNLPLFLFTLLGGLLVRRALELIGADHLLDGDSIHRLVGVAMEFVIVSAIASLRLEAVVTYLWPMLLLFGLAFVWTASCLLLVAPRVLPADRWFELGMINYGMSTGTTAQGMMLLRIVDENLESGAAEDYALAAPMSAPFIGGGVITFTLPLLLQNVAVPLVVATMAAAMIVVYLASRRLRG